MIKSKEELCSQEDPKTITQQLRVQTSSPLPMSLRLRTCPITASTMTTVPPGLPLIQNLLKNIQTQPHRSLQAAPDTLLALETMMLIQTLLEQIQTITTLTYWLLTTRSSSLLPTLLFTSNTAYALVDVSNVFGADIFLLENWLRPFHLSMAWGQAENPTVYNLQFTFFHSPFL